MKNKIVTFQDFVSESYDILNEGNKKVKVWTSPLFKDKITEFQNEIDRIKGIQNIEWDYILPPEIDSVNVQLSNDNVVFDFQFDMKKLKNQDWYNLPGEEDKEYGVESTIKKWENDYISDFVYYISHQETPDFTGLKPSVGKKFYVTGNTFRLFVPLKNL